MRFEREADYEPRLQRETRTLICDKTGNQYTLTIPAVYWASYDALLKYRDTKPSTLIESAEYWCKAAEEFENTFIAAIYCEHWIMVDGGRTVDAPLPPKPIIYSPSMDRWFSPTFSTMTPDEIKWPPKRRSDQ